VITGTVSAGFEGCRVPDPDREADSTSAHPSSSAVLALLMRADLKAPHFLI